MKFHVLYKQCKLCEVQQTGKCNKLKLYDSVLTKVVKG